MSKRTVARLLLEVVFTIIFAVCLNIFLRSCCATDAQQQQSFDEEQDVQQTEEIQRVAQQDKVKMPEVMILTSCDVNYSPAPVVSEYVERVVAAESRGESLLGQMAVAQCIRATAAATGQTPEQVVKVPNQYAQPVSASEVTESVKLACYRVFYLGENAVEDNIRYFYSTANGFYSSWHENNLEYVCTIGNHKFFK